MRKSQGCLLEFLLIWWFLNSWIWAHHSWIWTHSSSIQTRNSWIGTRNSWIGTRNSRIWTRTFEWRERDGTLFTDDLNEVYEEKVFWRRTHFMLPFGNAGKKYIKEVSWLLNAWTHEIKSLLLESETIQQNLTSNNNPKNVAIVLKKFSKLTIKGKINGTFEIVNK